MIPAMPVPAVPPAQAPLNAPSGLRDTVSSQDGAWTAMIFSAAADDDSLWLESGASGEMKCLLGRACGGSDHQQWAIESIAFSGDAKQILMTARTEASSPARRYSVDPASGRATLIPELTAAHVQTP